MLNAHGRRRQPLITAAIVRLDARALVILVNAAVTGDRAGWAAAVTTEA